MFTSLKTTLLFATLIGIILALGYALGGRMGLIYATIPAIAMSFGSYWFSDSIVLKMYNAQPVSQTQAPQLHNMVKEVCLSAGIPMPKICIIPNDSPNAFATGRNPENGVVAVTQGLMNRLNHEELKGVIAHEVAHIVNRDILIQTIASVMGLVIFSLANMLSFRSRYSNNNGNALKTLALTLLAPFAVMIIQSTISQTREYMADETGAKLCNNPLALASALEKISQPALQENLNAEPATESMFITSPLSARSMRSFARFFSTHPPINDRIARLKRMHRA